MKKTAFNIALFCCLLLSVPADARQNGKSLTVEPVVKWENAIGQLTDSHWGVNDMGKATRNKNERMSVFFARLQPGVIRLHHAGFVKSWTDNETQSWKKDVIRQELAGNALYAYRYGKKLMITLDACPQFISDKLPLTEAQEDRLAAFFAQLPGIIREAGYKGEVMYEFLNEKEKPYKDDYDSYWRMLNKIARAIKAADPAAECGGPAVSWPWQEVYEGFIDNCARNMDFVSFHLYARGPGEYPADDLFSGKHGYREQAQAAAAVVNYLEEKNIDHLDVYLDEFNVQYVWTPYQPAHHNHIGAAWMACFIKNVALTGVTGLNVWNTEDGAYGLNYVSAPARLYQLSNPYLRGTVVEGYDKEDRVEVIPVLSDDGGRSILFVNRTGECLSLENAARLLGCNVRKMKAFRIDGTTRTDDKVYDIGTIEDKSDITLQPYGLVLVTDIIR